MWVVTPGRAGTHQRVYARALGGRPHHCSHRAPYFQEPFSVGQLLQPSCRCSFPMSEGAASSTVSGDLEAASTARHRFASMRALPRCSTPGSFPRCHCFSHCPPLLGSRELVRLCGAAMCWCLDLHPYAACPTYASSQTLAPSAKHIRTEPAYSSKSFSLHPLVCPHTQLQKGAHDYTPGSPFPFFPLQKQLKYAARSNLPETLPCRLLT